MGWNGACDVRSINLTLVVWCTRVDRSLGFSQTLCPCFFRPRSYRRFGPTVVH
jgi:hypothetical protein